MYHYLLGPVIVPSYQQLPTYWSKYGAPMTVVVGYKPQPQLHQQNPAETVMAQTHQESLVEKSSDAPSQDLEDPHKKKLSLKIVTEIKAPTTDEESTETEKTDRSHTIQQRSRQIDYGLITEGYRRYRASNPPSTDEENPDRPKTPYAFIHHSKRKYDAEIGKWRRFLHGFDKTEYPADYELNPEWGVTETKIATAKENILNRELSTIFSQMELDKVPPSPRPATSPYTLFSLAKTNELSNKPLSSPRFEVTPT